MKNFVQNGEVLSFTAPAGGAVSGVPLQVGDMIVIPAFSAAAGYDCEGVTVGVFSLPKKAADVAEELVEAYWDAANGEVTIATGVLFGVFTEAAAAATTECNVRLNGVSVA